MLRYGFCLAESSFISEFSDNPVVPPVVVPPRGLSLEGFTLAYLEAHDLECPACGYNVRALRVARCPECGRAIALKVVGSRAGFSVPWVLSLITGAIGGGIGLFLAAVLVHERFPGQLPWQIIFVYFLAMIPMAPILLMIRRWFVRAWSWLQWGFAAAFTGVSLSMLIWFILKIEK